MTRNPFATSRGCALALAFVLLAATPAAAQIAVDGLEDEEVYDDRVQFTVETSAGFVTTAELDGAPVAVGTIVVVDAPDYHELVVRRAPDAGGAEESSTFQFIVRSTARGNSEWGLPPWVPHPVIPSAAEEMDGAVLQVVAPAAFPRGLAIPVTARVSDAEGRRLGIHGTVGLASAAGADVRLLRGVGSALLPAQATAGELDLAPSILGVAAERRVAIEETTTWSPLAGALAASTDLGEDARVAVTADVVVPAGATLTVGAGSVLRLAAGVSIEIAGALVVRGTIERPVTFTPASAAAPWGGLVLRTAAARLDATGAFFTGSGADQDWFDNEPDVGSSHRDEEPLIYVSDGARAELVDCWIFDLAGQGGHGEGGFLTMTRCLIQRCITAGQYNGGTVDLRDSALIEFPSIDAPFEDNDNDGLYLTGGAHSLSNCLIGWALDDGVDAGSGSAGSVRVEGCWFESCYHEAMAWSEGRTADVSDTVATNSGQGIECGFDNPRVTATGCVSTANLVGTRFGDNYDWDYEGFLTVSESILIENRRNVWGRNWDDWTERLGQMDIRGNVLGAADPLHPENRAFDPAADAALLAPYLASPGSATGVGAGLAVRGAAYQDLLTPGGVPVRLSAFTTATVTVDYRITAPGGVAIDGALEFPAGATVRGIPLGLESLEGAAWLRIELVGATNATLTGATELVLADDVTIIPRGAVWSFLDGDRIPPADWRRAEFDDGAWASGAAKLGFGDGDVVTPVDGGPDGDRHPAVYFRRRFTVADPAAFTALRLALRRDDGAVVYLNDVEVFRSNMPEGAIAHTTFAESSGTSESRFYESAVDPALLRADVNAIAVEVHQSDADSSDLGFDFELVGAPRVGDTTGAPRFLRGDANRDGAVDVSDAVRTLVHLFVAPGILDCADAADADDDGAVAMADAIFTANYLFRLGPPPVLPGPISCGVDPTDDSIDCAPGSACP